MEVLTADFLACLISHNSKLQGRLVTQAFEFPIFIEKCGEGEGIANGFGGSQCLLQL